MIIIGLESCASCKIFKEKYPNLPYKEVPRKVAEGDTQSINLKKRVSALGITEFPALVNDGMTKVLPLTMLTESK